jgi:hypothetical protein
MVLTQFLPSDIILSVWEPHSIFSEGLSLEVDSVTLLLALSLATFGLFTVLSAQRDQFSFGQMHFFSLCLLAGFGLFTLIPGNILTLCLSWVLWEVVIFIIHSLNPDTSLASYTTSPATIQRLIAVPLALAIGVLIKGGSAEGELLPTLTTSWVIGLAIITTLVRFGLGQNSLSESNGAKRASSIERMIRGISIASGFAFMGRVLQSGVSSDFNPILKVFGLALSIYGLLLMFNPKRQGSKNSSIALTLLGVGSLVELYGAEHNGEILIIVSSILLLSFSLQNQPNIKDRWRVLASSVVAITVIGLPGSIGGVLVEAIAGLFNGLEGIIIGGLIVLCLFGVALKILQDSIAIGEAKNDNQAFSTAGQLASTPFLLVAVVLMGLLIGWRISLGGVLIFAFAGVMLGMIMYVINMKKVILKIPFTLQIPRRSIDLFVGVRATFMRPLWSVVQTTARIFEGNAGLLWVYVIMQFILVAIGITE